MFVDFGMMDAAEYTRFWDELRRGKAQSGIFSRNGKRKTVKLAATYAPVLDENGNVTRIVKYALDVTSYEETGMHTNGSVKNSKKEVA